MKFHDRLHRPWVPVLQELFGLLLQDELVLNYFGGCSVEALNGLSLDGGITYYSPAFISLLKRRIGLRGNSEMVGRKRWWITWVIFRTTFDLRIIFLLIWPAPMVAMYLQFRENIVNATNFLMRHLSMFSTWYCL